MIDSLVTVVGNVATEPRHTVTQSGVHLTSMRVASTARRFDRSQGQWCDASTLFITVSCWRQLAQNVAASVHKGDPLIVTGRLRTRSYADRDEQRRVYTEVEASAVGHDLTRGVGQFVRGHPVGSRQAPDGVSRRGRAEEEDRDGAVPQEEMSQVDGADPRPPEEVAA